MINAFRYFCTQPPTTFERDLKKDKGVLKEVHLKRQDESYDLRERRAPPPKKKHIWLHNNFKTNNQCHKQILAYHNYALQK